jgi:Rrf2 family protein
MRLSARVDYALRAVAELAAAGGVNRAGGADRQAAGDSPPAADRPKGTDRPVTAERLAQAQQIPPKFLESILLQLRRGGVVTAQRGPEGGYRLARPADEISLAEIIRVIDGPLANVRGQRPEHVGYSGAAEALQDVWIALRASERQILELVTIADVAGGELPERVRELAADPRAWV